MATSICPHAGRAQKERHVRPSAPARAPAAANDNTYGVDELHVWVADQGFTDDWYNLRKSYLEAAERRISIRIIGVNDAPVVTIPDYVLKYQLWRRLSAEV